jgi:hypothetical protein
MATLDSIVSRVLLNLDRLGAPATEQAMVQDWVNQSIREDLCTDINWACMEFELDTVTTQGQDVLDVSALLASPDLLKDIDMVRFSIGDGYNYSVLPEVDQRVEFERFSDLTEAAPVVWARKGVDVRFRPIPDQTGDSTSYKIRINGWQYLPELSTGESNYFTIQHPYLLTDSVTSRGLMFYGEYEKSVWFSQEYEKQYQRAINVEKRSKSPANLVMRPSVTAGKPVSPISGWKHLRGPAYGWLN